MAEKRRLFTSANICVTEYPFFVEVPSDRNDGWLVVFRSSTLRGANDYVVENGLQGRAHVCHALSYWDELRRSEMLRIRRLCHEYAKMRRRIPNTSGIDKNTPEKVLVDSCDWNCWSNAPMVLELRKLAAKYATAIDGFVSAGFFGDALEHFVDGVEDEFVSFRDRGGD